MAGKVSVIIPFYYTRIDWLIASVESVLNQTYKNIEIILVNDGSDAELTQFLEKYGGQIKYFTKKNGGCGSARNAGMEVATGDYIAFHDADDLWHEDKLELQVALMQRTKSIWSHSDYTLFRDDVEAADEKYVDVSGFKGDVFQKCILSCPVGVPTMMIRTDFLKSHPELRFSDDFRYGEDTHLWMRIAVLNTKLEYIQQPLLKVRLHGSNKAYNIRVQTRVRSLIWRYVKKRRELYFGNDKFNGTIRVAYKLCNFSNEVLERLEKYKFSKGFVEFLSRVFYIIPYAIFKVYYKKLVSRDK
jgi:glycosyltransferase involved in cell wall biosynthesis